MVRYLEIHPTHPQLRLIDEVVECIEQGAVVAYPTDSSYAVGCHLGDKQAMDRIRSIRRLDRHHHFTLVCRDLSEIATYARIDNASYRLLKAHTPGPYTFLLRATSEVPRRLQHPRRKSIGIRVPDNVIVSTLLERLGQPIMSSTLIAPGEDMPMSDPQTIRDELGHQLDVIIDGGHCGLEPTSVINLAGDAPEIVREGRGDVSFLR